MKNNTKKTIFVLLFDTSDDIELVCDTKTCLINKLVNDFKNYFDKAEVLDAFNIFKNHTTISYWGDHSVDVYELEINKSNMVDDNVYIVWSFYENKPLSAWGTKKEAVDDLCRTYNINKNKLIKDGDGYYYYEDPVCWVISRMKIEK